MATMFSLTRETLARSPSQSPNGSEEVRVIEVTAKKYDFNPSPMRVKQGTRVRLKITATDHAHGFKIKDFPEGEPRGSSPGLVFSSAQDCQKIEKHQTETIESLARTPGTYAFKCCVRCGWRHRSMHGELIVEP
jgi:cytochrome c oxidase subunit 2